MATNPYVNKVVYDGTTIIDISDTTATASDVLNSKYIYTASGQKVQGSIASMSSSDLTVNGATVTAPAGFYSSSASKTVASGTEGTPAATKGTVSNHSVSVTPSVTNSAGYISGGTHSGTAVSVSASELVSGTYTVDSSGTKDVTNYASASIPSMTLPSGTSSSSSGTQKAIITPSTSQRFINIPTGFNDTAQYYNISPMNVASLNVTENGTYYASDPQYDLDGFTSVTVNVSGGGGSSVAIAIGECIDIPSATSSISFSDLFGDPTSFTVYYNGSELTVPSSTPYKIAMLVYDGTSIHGQTITNTSNAQVTYDGSSFSKSYSNGTLTLSSTGAYFQAGDYVIIYSYNGSAANVHTADVQVGSGATSITFTDLEDEPLAWYCIFKSNFSTSSGYQRVIGVIDNDGRIGFAMDSSAHPSSAYWSQSYSNGSLTITSTGTNNGGYFHQPGYYQLTYVIGEASPYEKVSKTYRASTTAQSEKIEPSTGYDAMSEVNVTIPAVTQTNLTAANIKSGTTVTISNGDSNLWSVTGTYSGGGGSSSIDTKTTTNSVNTATTLEFSSMKGQPIAWFLRCTSQIQSSGSTSYYYVDNIRYNGSNTQGTYCRIGGTRGIYPDTTHYSSSYSGTTLTITTTGSRTAAGGSFYNGGYELVYIY